MRKAYLVTYDHKGPATQYASLFETLKSFPGWWHYIDSTWIVVADSDARGVYEKLKPSLDNDINLLVVEVGSERAGWLPKKAWEWIKKNLPKQA